MSSFLILAISLVIYLYIMRKIKQKIEKDDAKLIQINSAIQSRIEAGRYARKATDNNVSN